MYKSILRPILFSFDPEKIHHFSFAFIRLAHKLGLGKAIAGQYRIPRGLEVEKMGLRFSNPVGLAAGFDKDGKLFSELASFGFGFVELGTVTPRPQAGNPKKRLFRLPKDQALINRMGFNNAGVDALVNRLKSTPKPPGLILGGNIGKNKDTPNERATEDYILCFEKLFDYVDYFVVNVSSPNTPNLRELQDKAPLTDLLHQLQSRNSARSKSKPILLKIAPDLNEAQLLDIVDIVRNTGIAGLVATNTTIDRSGLQTPASEVESIGAGGLSGKPVREKSTQVLRFLAERLKGEYTLIAVGGVYTAQDAREKLEAGADLVQVYTGFIYEGPAMVRRICRGLLTN